MRRPLAIIGDIHGDARRLQALLPYIANRQLIFVGDYVNRGAEARITLDLLLEVEEEKPETVFLMGNHEAALVAYMEGAMPFHTFATLGGIPTIRSYLSVAHDDVRSEFSRVFPEIHRNFIARCGTFYETLDMVVSHCGIDPLNPADRRADNMTTLRHEALFERDFQYEKMVVCGHYVQRGGKPYYTDSVVCLDTGCGTIDGPLTALLMPERLFVQQ